MLIAVRIRGRIKPFAAFGVSGLTVFLSSMEAELADAYIDKKYPNVPNVPKRILYALESFAVKKKNIINTNDVVR